MGGSNSVEIDTDLVNSLRNKDEKTVADQIINNMVFDNEVKVKELAIWIFDAANAAGNDREMTAKYARLVKLLLGIRVTDKKKVPFTFKDALMQLIAKKLEARLWSLSPNTFAVFLGELFNLEVNSAILTNYYLNELTNVPQARKQLLTVIRDKVESEAEKPEHEPMIDILKYLCTLPEKPSPASSSTQA